MTAGIELRIVNNSLDGARTIQYSTMEWRLDRLQPVAVCKGRYTLPARAGSVNRRPLERPVRAARSKKSIVCNAFLVDGPLERVV